MTLKKIAKEVDYLANQIDNQLTIGRLWHYDIESGLARIELLNYPYNERVFVDNAVVMNHGNLYHTPVPQAGINPAYVHQNILNAPSPSDPDSVKEGGPLVLLARFGPFSDQVYIILGTIAPLALVR